MFFLGNIFSNKNWISEWFHTLEERGECVDMTCGYQRSPELPIEYHRRSHAEADGVSSLVQLMKNLGYSAEIKVRKNRKRPSISKVWKAMKAHQAMSKTNHVHWKNIDKTKRGKSAGTCHRRFSEEDTTKITKFCQQNRVSMPNFLLWTLNKEIVKLQKSNSDPQFWMFPVNMRNLFDCNVDDENKSSFVAVQISEEMTPRDLSRQTMQHLRSNIHWGAWYGLQVAGKLLGKKAFEKAYDQYSAADHSWTGSFSYLGAWPEKADSNEQSGRENDNVFAAAIVTRFLPVGSAGIIWRDRLNIGLQLHPSLSEDIDLTEEIVGAWKDRIDQTIAVPQPETEALLRQTTTINQNHKQA